MRFSPARPVEFSAIEPHQVHDNCKFSSDRGDGAFVAPALRNAHSPGLQSRPFPAVNHEPARRLREIRADFRIAASGDAPVIVDCPGLESLGREPKVGADSAGPGKPPRIIDGSLECKSRHWAEPA
jgi:hypothetical protein